MSGKISDIASKTFEAAKNGLSKLPLPHIHNLNDHELAAHLSRQLLQYVYDFDSALDENHETAMKLVNFGQAITVRVNAIGYSNPNLISFFGTLEDESPVHLVQHISQISFLMVAVKRRDCQKPKRPIGFIEPPDDTLPDNVK